MNGRLDSAYRLGRAYRRWLAAEELGRDARAERALRGLFAALPMPFPTAGFADRVLAAAGLRASSAIYPWWIRVAIAASLLLAGLTSAYALPLVLGLTEVVAPGDVFAALVQGFLRLVRGIDELLALWRFCLLIIDTLLLIATAPPVVLTLLLLTTLSAFTFRALSELSSRERSPHHA